MHDQVFKNIFVFHTNMSKKIFFQTFPGWKTKFFSHTFKTGVGTLSIVVRIDFGWWLENRIQYLEDYCSFESQIIITVATEVTHIIHEKYSYNMKNNKEDCYSLIIPAAVQCFPTCGLFHALCDSEQVSSDYPVFKSHSPYFIDRSAKKKNYTQTHKKLQLEKIKNKKACQNTE